MRDCVRLISTRIQNFVLWQSCHCTQNTTNMNNNYNVNEPSFEITGNWDVQAMRLKGKYAQLTDSDLIYEAGKEQELLSRVETRLKKERDEVIKIIKDVQSRKIYNP